MDFFQTGFGSYPVTLTRQSLKSKKKFQDPPCTTYIKDNVDVNAFSVVVVAVFSSILSISNISSETILHLTPTKFTTFSVRLPKDTGNHIKLSKME